MSNYDKKDNSGALFANAKREKDSHPHATGTAMIGGVEYWVSAWTNKSEKGVVYQGLKFQPKEEQKEASSGGSPNAVPF